MTSYQSPDRIITIEVEDDRVTDVLIATGRRLREGELEAAIAHVFNAAFEGIPRAPGPFTQDQLDQISDITLASERMSAEVSALVEQATASLDRLDLRPPASGVG